MGEGPVLLFVHGAPDFRYLWHNQIDALSDTYKCVAMDTRGYNHSDKPDGVDNYDMKFLMSDIKAVIDDVGDEKVTLIAHDFGGFIAWYFTVDEVYKEKLNGLIIMNTTHPRRFTRTLANLTPQQVKDTEYARIFKNLDEKPRAIGMINAAIEGRMQRFWADKDSRVVALVKEASARNDRVSIINYYRANYPEEPYKEETEFLQIEVPALQFHGLDDAAVNPDGLSNTWEWINQDYTLVTYPGVWHIPQLEVPDRVTETMRGWLSTH